MTITSTTLQTHSDGSTSHSRLGNWVAEVAALTTPDRISWVTGSDQEWKTLTDKLVASGTFTRLNQDIKPNSFHCASNPSDVARVEASTFICSVDEKDAGPTNNWMAPAKMKVLLNDLYRGPESKLPSLLCFQATAWKAEGPTGASHPRSSAPAGAYRIPVWRSPCGRRRPPIVKERTAGFL